MRQALLCGAVTLVATLAATASAGVPVAGVVAGVMAGVAAGAVVLLAGSGGKVAVPVLDEPAPDARLREAMAANSQLRHDIRGALSPALLVSDRLTGHADPGVVKAGNIVVRAVERATALLEVNKGEDAARIAPEQDPGMKGGVSPPVR